MMISFNNFFHISDISQVNTVAARDCLDDQFVIPPHKRDDISGQFQCNTTVNNNTVILTTIAAMLKWRKMPPKTTFERKIENFR